MAVPRQPIPIEKIPEVISHLNPWDARFFRFMLLTGVRLCEARLLSDFDILNPDGVTYRPGFTTIHETKGGIPRNLAMSEPLIALFEECREAYGGKWRKYEYLYENSKHQKVKAPLAVFRPRPPTHGGNTGWRNHVVKPGKGRARPTRNSDRIPFGYGQDYIDRAFNEAFKKAGLHGPHTTHGIRKTFAEMVLDAQDESGRYVNDIYTLQALLGHASIQSTMHYVKGISVNRAMKALDSAYRSAGILPPNFNVPPGPSPKAAMGQPIVKPQPAPAPEPPKPFDAGVESY